jgi:hypothetical protein
VESALEFRLQGIRPMTRNTVHCVALVVLLAAFASPALAQGTASDGPKKTESVPPLGDGLKPHEGSRQEPRTKVPGTDGQASVLANGKLAVPGAPADVDTVPSKYSDRNAADDKLSIAEYRLKGLSAEQKQQIHKALSAPGNGQASGSAGLPDKTGAEVPASLVLNDLKPVPSAVADKIPALDGSAYLVVGGKVILVDATTRTVIGVITQ